jgi:hypothetical protein
VLAVELVQSMRLFWPLNMTGEAVCLKELVGRERQATEELLVGSFEKLCMKPFMCSCIRWVVVRWDTENLPGDFMWESARFVLIGRSTCMVFAGTLTMSKSCTLTSYSTFTASSSHS